MTNTANNYLLFLTAQELRDMKLDYGAAGFKQTK